eukprot:4508226-Prymnesium_polylepis.1
MSGSGGVPVQVARSYEGLGWEVTQPRVGLPSTLVQVDSCGSTSCVITIPADSNHVYYLDTVDVSARYGALDSKTYNDRAAARLLTQGTFGPTKETIASLSTLMASGRAY